MPRPLSIEACRLYIFRTANRNIRDNYQKDTIFPRQKQTSLLVRHTTEI